ncbi:hypothetical protein GCM10007901_06400 [Dyella acidisoli]|uniref:Uncharacterized protein n=1 Tax=Dyella acidisoli TaxID=1867834 RepID=A0ABQ5XJ19_9GAMM|nr:hypothetical protein GCM10007901_06400 [Dyella acidisoli]
MPIYEQSYNIRAHCMLAARVARALGCTELIQSLVAEARSAHAEIMAFVHANSRVRKHRRRLRLAARKSI